jgi:hypothetical protein
MKFKLADKPPPPSGLAAGEKRRLAILIAGFVVVAGALLTTLYKAGTPGERAAPQPVLDETRVSEPLLAVPELDLARLEREIADSDPADHVVLESAAADLVLDAARRYTPRHYTELAAPELDAERSAALCADAPAARGKPFTARGRIVGLRPRAGAAHEDQFLGRLELEDGSAVHFLVLAVPEGANEIGGFVRVDGLFLKVYSTEDELAPGTWQPGPLLVGARAERSFPSFGTVTQLDLSLFDDLEDADLSAQPPRIVPETQAEPFWHVMAFARDLPPDALDWSQAPTLDQRLIDELLADPVPHRGMPVRIPISRLQDGRVRLAGENPARMTRTMQGWIGNNTWKSVIQFRTPVLRPDLRIADLVYGRGFFLHLFSYESSQRGLRVAPVFVLQSLEQHVPESSPALLQISLFVAGVALFLGILFVVLARRDKRQASAFHDELVRRRRQRRTRGKDGLGTAAR